MNTLVIEKQTGGYFKFTLNGDTANAITSIQNDLLAVGTQLHFKTGNGANIIKEQFIYPADVTIIASGTFTFSTVAQVWDKLIEIDYFAWLGGGGTGGVDRFDDLLDTFSYTGNAGKAVVVDGAELRLVPITLYNKRLFTELEDTPSSLVPNKMLVVNPTGTAVVLQDQPEQPEQLLNSVGYFDYNDLITQTTPLNAVANVALKLTNDTEGANTSTDQNPYGVSYVWDYTTNAFNFSELEVGDTIDVRIHVQVTTTTSNQKVDLKAKLGIGSASEFTNTIYENQFKTAGLHEVNFVAPFYMGSTDITDYPAELYLTTDASATVKVDGWYVRILRKNINIITVDYTVPDATGSVKGIVRLAGDLAGTANSPTVPELANKVPNTRTVSTTSPLLGGGALSSNLTLSIQQANSVDSGYLSNVDWSTFNGKANDNAVVKLTGDQTISGVKTFSNPTIFNSSLNIASGAYSILYNPANSAYWQTYVDSSNVFNFGYNGNIVKASISNSGNFTANSFIKSGGTSSQFLKADGSVDGTTYANDNAVVHLTGAETITGKKTFNSSAGSSDAIEIISNSTGYGIKLSHPSGGSAIFIDNPVGVGLNVNNIGTNSFGISISNPSTGRAIDISNSGAGTGIYYSNSGSGNGIYSNNAATGVGIQSNNTGAGTGFFALNNSTGRAFWISNSGSYGIYSENAGTGYGMFLSNSGTGTAIYSSNSSSGKNLILNNSGAATGMPFTVSKNGTDVFTINDAGEATGVKFIKSGGTSSQFLKADGSVDSTTYQTALTNPVTGTGTTNYIPKFTGASAIGNSIITDSGAIVDILANSSASIDTRLSVSSTGNGGAGRGTAILMKVPGSSSSANGVKINAYTVGGAVAAQSTDLAFDVGLSGTLVERMRITSGGDVLIGKTTALYPAAGRGVLEINGAAGGSSLLGLTVNNATSFYIYTRTADTELYATNPLLFSVNGSERMRLNSNGELLIGRTSSYGAGWQLAVEGNVYAKYDLRIDGEGSFGDNVLIGTTSELQGASSKLNVAGDFYNANGISLKTTNGGAGSQFIGFINESGTLIGSINRVSTTNAVAYNTTSDYRLKEDLKPIKGLELISKIKVYDFKWKNHTDRMDGVLAHELQEVVPYAVSGEKDAEKMQSVDYSKLVPILVQAIQDQQKQIDELKTLINK